ncbi:hypothetical protein [Streptomyces sp. NPDC002587]
MTQDDVAQVLFDGNYHTTLRYLDALVRSRDAVQITSFGVYQWVPAGEAIPVRATVIDPSALQAQVLAFITEEFREGCAGNRRYLPSTRDVARLLSRSRKPQYALAQYALDSLLQSDQIIRVADEDETRRSHTFWALYVEAGPGSEWKPDPDIVLPDYW